MNLKIFIIFTVFYVCSSNLWAEKITIINTPPTINGIVGTPVKNVITKAKDELLKIIIKPKKERQGVLKINGDLIKTGLVNTVLKYSYTIKNDTEIEISYRQQTVIPATPPTLINYTFTTLETKNIVGKSTEFRENKFNCKGDFKTEDQIGRLLLVALFYSNGCYTDGRYNNNDYLVDKGQVTVSNSNKLFDAYRIKEPSTKNTSFLGSQHGVYYKFPTKEDYSVYELKDKAINLLAQVSAAQIDLSQFIKVADLSVSKIKGTQTLLFVPKNQRVSVFNVLGNEGVDGALLATTTIGNVSKYRYPIEATIFDNRLDYTYAPSNFRNVSALSKQFFLIENIENQVGVVWQDKNNSDLKLTWMGADFITHQALTLPNTRKEDLAAVTYDENGNIYYLTIQSGSGTPNEIARSATLYQVDSQGNQQNRKELTTTKSGLNIINFSSSNVASLQYLNGQLGLILARKMHKSSDGLNHQGAIAVIFDAKSLAMVKHLGQTSGHSLDNIVLTHNSQNEFLGVDLGDNFPRGINVHKFTEQQRRSRVVYTFKTKHGTQAKSPAGVSYPFYSEISQGTNYYKWSNDNNTYTELAGMVENDLGYGVLFAGEPFNNKAIDNSRVGKTLNDPRNIGMVLVRKDFEKASGSGNEVSDDLILTSGITEEGGLYTFGGSWAAQRNKGVVWLTNYKDKTQENATRVKVVAIDDDKMIILWEKWTDTAYINTYAMKVDSEGKALSDPLALGSMVRLNRTDDIFFKDKKIYVVMGNKNEKKLELVVFDLK